MIFGLDERLLFPDPALADDDGLLAIGGDLSIGRLLLAYQNGIFPWYSDDSPIMWYAPHERFVLYPDKLNISKSMRQLIRSGRLRVTFNQNFQQVITACADTRRKDHNGTWITSDMQQAYIELHQHGHAYSVETWLNNELVGGLYGVKVGAVFCGESMFSRVSNASKMALIMLCQTGGYKMIDCQLHTDHLASMGAEIISQANYLSMIR